MNAPMPWWLRLPTTREPNDPDPDTIAGRKRARRIAEDRASYPAEPATRHDDVESNGGTLSGSVGNGYNAAADDESFARPFVRMRIAALVTELHALMALDELLTFGEQLSVAAAAAKLDEINNRLRSKK